MYAMITIKCCFQMMCCADERQLATAQQKHFVKVFRKAILTVEIAKNPAGFRGSALDSAGVAYSGPQPPPKNSSLSALRAENWT